MQADNLLKRVRNYALPNDAIGWRGTWLRQEGEMRFAPDGPWKPFRAEQWFPGGGIEFRWQAWVRMAPLMRAYVIDSFEGGRGMLTARIFGVIPMARSRGPATDKGEAMRALAEIPWRPFAFQKAPQLIWETVEANRLSVTFDDGRTHAAVIFEIDDKGQVRGAAASRRPRMVGKSVVETAWSGTFGEYKSFEGIRVPTVAEVTWDLREGPFTYWRGRVSEFRVLR